MKPDPRFTNLPKAFWAYVRIIGQSCGYSKKGIILIPERLKVGKSYLCRIADMLHMGYIDEVLVGKEIIIRLPEIVQEWIKIKNNSSTPEL